MTPSLKVLVPLAPGFEEIEAVTVIDVLRRAHVEVVIADLCTPGEARQVNGSHEITIASNQSIDALFGRASEDGELHGQSLAEFDAIVLPGGMPGAANLRDDPRVQAALREMFQRGKLVAAICAAPIALARAGLLEGRRATAYPAFRDQLAGATVVDDQRVVVDGNLITSAGPGTALEFSLRLVAQLVNKETADQLAKAMLLHDLMRVTEANENRLRDQRA